MPATDTLLSSAERCLLALRADDGPMMTSQACWSDGGGVWMLIFRAATVAALRGDPRCTVWITPPETSDPGVAVEGSARMYELSDPAGLWLHAATVGGALAALALRHRAELSGYVRGLPQLPGAPLSHRPVLVRVRVEQVRTWLAPQQVTGVGPALPAVVPGAVRRALTGIRHVALALQDNDQLTVQPAAWSAGYQLVVGTGTAVAADTPACVVVEQRAGDRPSARSGLQLLGAVDSDLRLRPATATWWHGFSTGSTPVPAPASSSGLVLPD